MADDVSMGNEEEIAFIDTDRSWIQEDEEEEEGKQRNGENSATPMLPELENCEFDDERIERPSSTRSCPESIASKAASRAAASRRSLKETGIGRRLTPLVHKALPNGLERISEDFVSTVEVDDKPVAPARPNRLSFLQQQTSPREDGDATPPVLSPTQSERSVAERIEAALHHNYYTLGYGVILVAYLVGFTEYVYLRILSIVAPEHNFYHPGCEDKQDRRIGKDGFHYGISIAAFLAIALFQLICFFGLTISENWTTTHGDNVEPRREQFAARIRLLIGQTMYRVFLCYSICSLINCTIIFYMVGIQDSLGDTVSTVFLYVFDAVVILYFIAFPLTTIVYHPQVHCFRKKRNPPPQLAPPSLTVPQGGPRSQSSTLESTISGLEEYVQSPRRPTRTTTNV